MRANFLCLSEELKGVTFIKALKDAGCGVFVVTREKSRDKAWPREMIDEFFVQPDSRHKPHDRQTLIEGTAWLMRERGIDRVVALDDFDVEDAALIREEFRIPGMGQTTARHFRDKLAMRMIAQERGVPSPDFSAMFRREEVAQFCEVHPGPYVIKPRGEASASGIQKVSGTREALVAFDELGDQAYRYLIETFAPGQVFHVDAVVKDQRMVFARASGYVSPPLTIVQAGGTFQTRTLATDSTEHEELCRLTGEVMRAFGMRFSASHTEWIQDARGRFLFLETSSRVGGAHIADMVERASGVDLWAEWARLELAELRGEGYRALEDLGRHAAVTIRTTGVADPDLSNLGVEEVCATFPMQHHAAVLMSHRKLDRVARAQDKVCELLDARFGKA